MSNGIDNVGIKEWLNKLERKLDTLSDVAVQTEAKLDGVVRRLSDNEKTLKAHAVRISALENRFSGLEGSFKAFVIVGGVIFGLVAISEVLILLLK